MNTEQENAKDSSLVAALLNLLHQAGYLEKERLDLLLDPEQLSSLATFLSDIPALVDMLIMFDVKIQSGKLEEMLSLAKQLNQLKAVSVPEPLLAAELIKELQIFTHLPASHFDELLADEKFLANIEAGLTEELMSVISPMFESIATPLTSQELQQNDSTSIKGEVVILQMDMQHKSIIENNGYLVSKEEIEESKITPLTAAKRGSFIIYKGKNNKQLATIELMANGTILSASIFDHNKVMLIPRIDRYLNPLDDLYDIIMETPAGLQYFKQHDHTDLSHSQINHRDSRARLYNNTSPTAVIEHPGNVASVLLTPVVTNNYNDNINIIRLKGKLIFLQLDSALMKSVEENKYELPLEWIEYYQIHNIFMKQNELTTTYVDNNHEIFAVIELIANGQMMKVSHLRNNAVVLVPRLDREMQVVHDSYDFIMHLSNGIFYIKVKDDVISNSQISHRDSRVESLVHQAMDELFPK